MRRRRGLAVAIAALSLGAGLAGLSSSPSFRASARAAYRAFRDPSLLDPALPAAAPATCTALEAGSQGRDGRQALDAEIAVDQRILAQESLDDPDGAAVASLVMSDLHVPITRRTLRFVRHFARSDGGRASFLARYRRAGMYREPLERALREAGLPEDLMWLAAIESGFDPHAVSPAGAAGLFQFMPETGALYGLEQSPWVDERRSLGRATTAAVTHLRDLYERFGRWDLALAAYNAGYDGVVRAMDKVARGRSPDEHRPIGFAELSAARALSAETINYVPQIVAFALVAANRSRFGLDQAELLPSLELGEVAVPNGTRLRTVARAAGLSMAVLREDNPQLLRDRVPPTGGDYLVAIPAERVSRALASFPAYLDQEVLAQAESEDADAEGEARVASARGAGAGLQAGPQAGSDPGVGRHDPTLDLDRDDPLPRRPAPLGRNRLPAFPMPGQALVFDLAAAMTLGGATPASLGKLPMRLVGAGIGWQRAYDEDPLGVLGGGTRVAAKAYDSALEKELAGLGLGGAASPGAGEGGTTFTLANGVTVRLRRDPSAPLAAITVSVVSLGPATLGARGDGRGRATLAGCGGRGRAEGGRTSARGAAGPCALELPRGNGETTHTLTVDPRDLDTGLELAAGHLKLLLGEADDEHFAAMRARAAEPRRRALAKEPYGPAWLLLGDTLFPSGHPLAGAVVGGRDDPAIARDTVLTDALFQERTRARASLTVVGDVNEARARTLIEAVLGPVASGLASPFALEAMGRSRGASSFALARDPGAAGAPRIEPHPRFDRLALEAAVPSPRLLYGWVAPGRGEPGDAALEVAMEVLFNPKLARLERALVEHAGLATAVHGLLDGEARASVLAIDIEPAAGHDAGEVERRLDAELEALGSLGPTAVELATAKLLLRVRLERELAAAASPLSAAGGPHLAGTSRLERVLYPEQGERLLAAIAEVSAGAVTAAVHRTLSREHRVLVATVPRAPR